MSDQTYKQPTWRVTGLTSKRPDKRLTLRATNITSNQPDKWPTLQAIDLKSNRPDEWPTLQATDLISDQLDKKLTWQANITTSWPMGPVSSGSRGVFLRNYKLLSWSDEPKTEDVLSVVRLRKGGLLVSGEVGSIWIPVRALCLIELLFLFMQNKNVKVWPVLRRLGTIIINLEMCAWNWDK